jgi:hypothetical protein
MERAPKVSRDASWELRKLSSAGCVAYASREAGGRALLRQDKQASEVTMLAHVRGHYVMARWRNVIVVYWLGQGTVKAVQNVDALLAEFGGATARKLSCVHLIKDGAGVPDHDTRLAVRALHDRHAQRLACLGIVPMGEGFWASSLKRVFTALRIVGGTRTSLMRFARTTTELAAWLPREHAARTGVQLDEQQLAAVLESVLDVGDAPPALAS